MASPSRSDYKPRNTRFQSLPDRHNNFVRFAAEIKGAEDHPAQYADVSLSGMRLISRKPAKTHVGDVMSVEFTLPGTPAPIRNLARVVRKMNDYEFAVRFVDTSPREFQNALHEHELFLESERLTSLKNNIVEWIVANKRGLMLSMVALGLATLVSSFIYLNSNQRVGVVESWGKPIQKEWFGNYYGVTPDQK